MQVKSLPGVFRRDVNLDGGRGTGGDAWQKEIARNAIQLIKPMTFCFMF